jgi:hypothetical protein
MVNSYLTFLVEQGWWWSLAVVAGGLVLWVWTRPVGDDSFSPALWASILAFLVAGVFSTTMEEWRLWVLPLAACLFLAGNAIWNKRPLDRKSLMAFSAIVSTGCAMLWGVGMMKSQADPLRREFGSIDGSRTVTAVGPRAGEVRALGCLVDERVVGDQYARLLRELALDAGVRIVLGDAAQQADRVLVMGHGVHSCGGSPNGRLLLLAPEAVVDEEMDALVKRSGPITVMLPEIDEDGRVGFWEEVAEGDCAERFQTSALSGKPGRLGVGRGDRACERRVNC